MFYGYILMSLKTKQQYFKYKILEKLWKIIKHTNHTIKKQTPSPPTIINHSKHQIQPFY